jgi:thiamine-monophosphate kinase
MDEFEIIRKYFDRESDSDSVITGIGDDGAVTRPDPGNDIITVIDTMVAGIHFPLSLDPADIGYRAVAVNLSDIAAMGATPKWMTLALTMSDSDPAWLAAFAAGLFQAADEHGVALVGGDTTRGNELVVTIQIAGAVEPGKAMLRSGAKAGDAIYVTGPAGDAAAGLSILQSGAPRNADIDYLVHRFARPTARVEFGRAISTIATAAIDLSDGLFTDIEKLLNASNVSGVLEINEIPLSSQLRATMSPDDALRFALGGGDDYELAFTSSAREDAIREIAGNFDVTVTCIGSVVGGDGLTCTQDGAPFDYRSDGYRHFH